MKEVKIYECEKCGYRCESKGQMEDHEKAHMALWRFQFNWPKFNMEEQNAFIEYEQVDLIPAPVNEVFVWDRGNSVSLAMYVTEPDEKKAVEFFVKKLDEYLRRLNSMKAVCFSRLEDKLG